MLDLTVIFLIAGFLFSPSHRAAKADQDASDSPGDWERTGLRDFFTAPLAAWSQEARVQPAVRLQWMLCGLVVLLGVVYAIAFVATNPFYDRFSFSTSRLMLVKLLPSMALGFLSGTIVRIGLRSMSPFLLAMGAVFFVLPFLLTNGIGMLKAFNKIKVGPWFEAEVNSTEEKRPVQLQLQALVDRSVESDFSALTTSEMNSLINKNSMAQDFCRYLQCSETNTQPSSLIASQAEESIAPASLSMNGASFYRNYLEAFVTRIASIDDGSLSRERAIREAVDPVAKAGETLLQTARNSSAASGWPNAWCSFLRELRKAESDLGQPGSIGETSIRPLSGGTPGCDDTSATNAILIPSSDFTTTALPHILIARLYRRAGFDARALRVLERADRLDTSERMEFSNITPPAKASEWAELLIERGDLRYSLGDEKWGEDWRNAIDLREKIIAKLWSAHNWELSENQIAKACQQNRPNKDSLQAVAARLETDTAQLRNRYVFSLIGDSNQRRAVTLDEVRLDDVVALARQNYLNLKRLSLLSSCLQDTQYAACSEVIYPDTYALALMAAAQQQDSAGQQDTSIQIEGLLERALEAVLGPENQRCPQWQDFQPIIQKHRKLASSLAL